VWIVELGCRPELAVADGALGFWQAIEEVGPKGDEGSFGDQYLRQHSAGTFKCDFSQGIVDPNAVNRKPRAPRSVERFAYDGDDMALGWLARSGSMSYPKTYESSKTS
jgi:hypothetical protein